MHYHLEVNTTYVNNSHNWESAMQNALLRNGITDKQSLRLLNDYLNIYSYKMLKRSMERFYRRH